MANSNLIIVTPVNGGTEWAEWGTVLKHNNKEHSHYYIKLTEPLDILKEML